MTRSIRTLILGAAVTAALACAAIASASGPDLDVTPFAPKSCGLTKSHTYVMKVSSTTSCAFAKATYRELVVRLNAGLNEQINSSVKPVIFTLRPHATVVRFTHRVRAVLDCRANGLAHGQVDIYCNDLNLYGTEVVDFANATEP